jgi:hypothetical protein
MHSSPPGPLIKVRVGANGASDAFHVAKHIL